MRVTLLLMLSMAAWTAEWSPSLSMKLKSIAEVIPSPDGKSVIWLETKAMIETEKSEMLTQIHFALVDGSGRRQLTQGDKSATAPAWAPDGKSIFFVSERSGKRNLYRLPVQGGEAEKLTDWKGVLGQHRVSPDGRFVAFTATGEDKELEKRRKEKLDFRVIGATPPRQSLWLLELKENAAAPKNLLKGEFHVASFDWSPDGKQIVLDRRVSSEPNEADSADIMELEVASYQGDCGHQPF